MWCIFTLFIAQALDTSGLQNLFAILPWQIKRIFFISLSCLTGVKVVLSVGNAGKDLRLRLTILCFRDANQKTRTRKWPNHTANSPKTKLNTAYAANDQNLSERKRM